MNSLRKWLYKPKKTDGSLLAQFYYADEELNTIAAELDSFDGRKDPERCTILVSQLRHCQDKVLNICQMIMDEVIPNERASRDFRAKFPDDVLQENLAGQLWFGAECLAAGSSILNRDQQSLSMRPLAKALTKNLENVRNLLREQCFRSPPEFTEKICECLKILDRLFAEFELSYVSAMVPVKCVYEYEAQQAITVLFSETLQRALKIGLLSQEQVDSCDPALMFTIPRLAIVSGLLIFPDGPLCLDRGELSEMFRPFHSLLLKIRELLRTLSRSELSMLERALCSVDEPELMSSLNLKNENVGCTQDSNSSQRLPSDYLEQFFQGFPSCKEIMCLDQMIEPSVSDQSITDLTQAIQPLALSPNDPNSFSSSTSIEETTSPSTINFPAIANIIASNVVNVGIRNASRNEGISSGVSSTSAASEKSRKRKKSSRRTDSNNSNASSCNLPTSTSTRALARDNREAWRPTFTGDNSPSSNYNLLNSCSGNSGPNEADRASHLAKSNFTSPSKSSNKEPSRCPDHNNKAKSEGQDAEQNTEHVPGCWCSPAEWSEADSQRSKPGNSNAHMFSETCFSENQPCTYVNADTTNSHSSSRDSGLSSMAESENKQEPTTSNFNNQQRNGVLAHLRTLPTSQNPITNAEDKKKHDLEAHQKPDLVNTNSSPVPPITVNSSDPTNETPRRSTPPGNETHTLNSFSSLNYPTAESNATSSQLCDNFESETSSEDTSLRSDDKFEMDQDTSDFYQVQCVADEQIAVAMQTDEIAYSHKPRSRFKSVEDLIHRLFICISGVADQLQTNYAADFRATLKCVFAINATPVDSNSCDVGDGDGNSSSENSAVDLTPELSLNEENMEEQTGTESRSIISSRENSQMGCASGTSSSSSAPVPNADGELCNYRIDHDSMQATNELVQDSESNASSPPIWIPDKHAPHCMSCSAVFTVVRRRHHCRNCGKVFCGKCSSNSVPLPKYGHLKPVRVCNRCFVFSVTQFTVPASTTTHS